MPGALTSGGATPPAIPSGYAGCFASVLGANFYQFCVPNTYGQQLSEAPPAGVPTVNQIKLYGAPVSGVTTFAWTTFSSTNLTDASAVPHNNSANTWTNGLHDFSGATIKLPSSPGFVASSASHIGLDTTANKAHIYNSAADAKVATYVTPGSTNDCVKWASDGQLTGAGAACSAGSGTSDTYVATVSCSSTPTTVLASTHGQGTTPQWVSRDETVTPPAYVALKTTLATNGDMTFTCGIAETLVIRISQSKAVDPNIAFSFSGASSLSVTQPQHNFGLPYLRGQYYDTSTPRVAFNAAMTVNSTTLTALTTFALAASGLTILGAR